MRLLLASLSISAALPLVSRPAAGRRIVVIPNAADHLPERDAIVAALVTPLRAAGWHPVLLDLTEPGGGAGFAAALDDASVIAVGGGDPFHLRRTVGAAGVAAQIVGRVRAGMPYIGVSAGAMLAASSLAPLRHTSPFAGTAEVGLLPGLGLTDRLVLAHHDREGRAARHGAAAAAHPGARLVPLTDDEVLVVDGDGVVVWGENGTWRSPDLPGVVVERAVPEDGAALAGVFSRAARVGWAPFLGREPMDRLRSSGEEWTARVPRADGDAALLVARRDDGIVGFIGVERRAEGAGELDVLFVDPRAWGQGVGRLLHTCGIHLLRRGGARSVSLWTEARNERPQRIYAALGYRPTGERRARVWLEAPIVEDRLTRRLE